MTRKLLLSVLLMLGVGFALIVNQSPQYIHLSWQHDPTTTMTIMWRTGSDVTDSVVEYGRTAQYGSVAIGTTEPYFIRTPGHVLSKEQVIQLLTSTPYSSSSQVRFPFYAFGTSEKLYALVLVSKEGNLLLWPDGRLETLVGHKLVDKDGDGTPDILDGNPRLGLKDIAAHYAQLQSLKVPWEKGWLCLATLREFGYFIPQYRYDPKKDVLINQQTGKVYYPKNGRFVAQDGEALSPGWAYEKAMWHVVELTGLEPNTVYHYRCGAEGKWSSDYYFRTAPKYSSNTVVKIAVFGDSRGGWNALAECFQAAKKEGAQLIVFTGDLTNEATQPEYDGFFSASRGVLEYIPFMPVHGNHERELITYFGEFALPGNEKYFSFDFGPIHFTYLYSYTEADVAQQCPWLLKDLSITSLPWKIVVAHKTIYSSGTHGITPYLMQYWVPIFDKTGVDFYINGHDHIYERSWPIKEGKIDPNGTVYITTGGAGAPLYPVKHGNWWTAVAESAHHYIILLARSDEIEMTVKRIDGSVLDSVCFKKP